MDRAILAVTLATLVLTPGVASTQERIKRFVFISQRDEMSDHDTSVLFTKALEVTIFTKPQLTWRCNGRKVALSVFADEFLDNESISVQYRFDSDPAARTQRWYPSTDGTAAYAPSGTIPYFTTTAMAASSVLIRVWDYQGTRHDMRFSLMGLTAGLAKLPCAPRIAFTAKNGGAVDGDEKSVTILPASSLGRQAAGAHLLLWCSADAREASVIVPAVPRSGPRYPLTIRTFVDSLHIQPDPWIEVYTGGRFNAIPSRGGDLRKLILRVETLDVGIFLSGGLAADLVFRLAGLTDSVSSLPCWSD